MTTTKRLGRKESKFKVASKCQNPIARTHTRRKSRVGKVSNDWKHDRIQIVYAKGPCARAVLEIHKNYIDVSTNEE